MSLTGAKSYVGWKAISKRIGVKDPRTTRRWVVKYGVPVLFMGRTPTLDEAIYRVWLVSYAEVLRERKEKAPHRGPGAKSGVGEAPADETRLGPVSEDRGPEPSGAESVTWS